MLNVLKLLLNDIAAIDEMGGDLALRPEGTAGVCRAFIQNGWDKSESLPLRLFYTGPMFRYERPQKGRKRQFHQFGIEVIGTDSPTADAEVVEMAVYFLQCLKIDNFKVSINSIGDTEDRQNYIETLRKFYAQYENELSDEARATLERSPLRMLEAQSTPRLKELAQKAPEAYHKMYSQPARDHWETFLNCSNRPYQFTATTNGRSTPNWCADSTTTTAPSSR